MDTYMTDGGVGMAREVAGFVEIAFRFR